MRTVKFNSTEYTLVDHENVLSSSFQATILKEDYSVEDITEEATGAEEIKVYDGDTLLGVYDGYVDRIAISLYTAKDADVVSVELQNADVMAQLDSLTASVEAQATVISSQDAAITDLASEVAVLDETQASQDAAIEDIASIVYEE